jgi:hypothetical protein
LNLNEFVSSIQRAPTKKTNPATARKIEATDTALAVVKNVATVFVDAFDQSERAGFAARSLLYVSLGGNNKTYEPFNDAMLETIRAAVPPKGKRTVLVKAGFAALSKVEEDPRSLVGLRKRRGDGFDFAALVNGTAAVDQAQVRTVAVRAFVREYLSVPFVLLFSSFTRWVCSNWKKWSELRASPRLLPNSSACTGCQLLTSSLRKKVRLACIYA